MLIHTVIRDAAATAAASVLAFEWGHTCKSVVSLMIVHSCKDT